MPENTLLVIGGGAAGFFAAIAAAEANPSLKIKILEQSQQPLGKVKISGGGRCNVTHHCTDPRELITHYPRGSRELLGPFTRFGPAQTIEWFRQRGVELKTEADGRMFPVTDDSQTIVDCLVQSAQQAGVELLLRKPVDKIFPPQDKINKNWTVVAGGEMMQAAQIIVATGSSTRIWQAIEKCGHTIVPPVASLFTFNIRDERIKGLAGVSVQQAQVEIAGTPLSESGPLLITHWGMSGPAILRLSAWGARMLHEMEYQFTLVVAWTSRPAAEWQKWFAEMRQKFARKHVQNSHPAEIPQRLWERLCEAADVPPETRWADLNSKQSHSLMMQLSECRFQVKGKSTFKDEFVTAGGVKLDEVNFRTMESKRLEGLFFAGEALDIDAITGGFNFQAAWTTGWIAGNSAANQ